MHSEFMQRPASSLRAAADVVQALRIDPPVLHSDTHCAWFEQFCADTVGADAVVEQMNPMRVESLTTLAYSVPRSADE